MLAIFLLFLAVCISMEDTLSSIFALETHCSSPLPKKVFRGYNDNSVSIHGMGNTPVQRPLHPAELQYLANVLGVSVYQLQQMYQEFMQFSKNGYMSKHEFRHFYRTFAPWGAHVSPRKVKRITDRIYAYFDFDRNGYLSFNEFMAAMVMLHGRGDVRDKLTFLFQCNTPDGAIPPTLSPWELQRILRALDGFYDITGYDNIYDIIIQQYPGRQDLPTAEIIDIINTDYTPVMAKAFEGESSSQETE